MKQITDFIQADDETNFIQCIRESNINLQLFRQNGSKKECVFCQCAYYGSCSCIRAAVANDIVCIHNDKNASYFAASSNQINALQFLNNLGQDFENAILGAIKYGHYQSFIWILENHYDTAYRNMKNCESLFNLAAQGGNIKIFQYLKREFQNEYVLEEQKYLKSNTTDSTPLHQAIANNHLELAEFMLSQHQTIKLTDSTLLTLSIYNNNISLFQMLLKFFDPHVIDSNTLMNCAIQSKNTDFIQLLVNQYALKTNGLLFAAISSDSVDFVKSLLKTFPLNINEKNEYGIIPQLFSSNSSSSCCQNWKH